MCLIAFSFDSQKNQLLLAANRDEYYNRPTAAAHWWPDGQTFAGKDLLAGGTWLAVNSLGRLAALTNYRSASAAPADALSRGSLVTRALDPAQSVASILNDIAQTAEQYAGFNLLVMDWDPTARGTLSAWYLANHGAGTPRRLASGVYGLSNGYLDEDWPKTKRLRAQVADAAAQAAPDTEYQLLMALTDRAVAPDTGLPDTGVGISRERMLSAAFIRSDDAFAYGTRTSAIVQMTPAGALSFSEWTWLCDGAGSGHAPRATGTRSMRIALR